MVPKKVIRLEVIDEVFTRVHFEGSNHVSNNDFFSVGKVKVGDLVYWDSHGSVWMKV